MKNGETQKVLAMLSMIASSALTAPLQAEPAEQWGSHEIVFDGPETGNPYLDVQLSAVFQQDQTRLEVPGFWDGGTRYRVRFMPPSPGVWQYRTKSNRKMLDGQAGSFSVIPAKPGNHGPVQVAHTWHFGYADGTPYHQIGTTCYAWIHQPDDMQEQTLRTLASSPFNKIRFCIFPKSYTYNQNEPDLFAFQAGPGGGFDFDRPDPRFWHHLETRIRDLQALGIEADLILWHPYDRWGFSEMAPAQDDRYLRYCIARLSAYRNVWWSLANEFDLMAPRTTQKGHRGNKEMSDWDRFFSILAREDPFDRLRGIHNCREFYDHTKPWVTHASIQRHDLPAVARWRTDFRKPIVVDECGYEGNVPQGWGNLTAREMTRRFWLGTICGGYVGHGETYKHPKNVLWWSKGDVLHGESPARIAFLKEIMGPAAFHKLEPRGEASPGNYLLSDDRDTYFVYFTNPMPTTISLAGGHDYKVDAIDPWAMTVTPLGSASPGAFRFAPPLADFLVRIAAYQPGEVRRPTVRAEATPTEGLAPLAVQFNTQNKGALHWAFGDGESSSLPNPSHTFRQPGLYTAKLTVTAPSGAEAATLVDITVDRDTAGALVRVGTGQDDTHRVTLHGQVARNGAGAFLLPPGDDWGWVGVGEGPVEALEGLRSFTVTGWLHPTSLETGSGGNRVVFNLNRNHGGFDLVQREDGSLRLAVNEWPDAIRNDSSPHKLPLDQWTFFAVTYDSTRAEDNVQWYFGAPDHAAAPDRTTAYHAGPTGRDSGNLTVGNYNETLHGHGLDRQFRGRIRDLRIFGSRISGRGALSLEQIREAQ